MNIVFWVLSPITGDLTQIICETLWQRHHCLQLLIRWWTWGSEHPCDLSQVPVSTEWAAWNDHLPSSRSPWRNNKNTKLNLHSPCVPMLALLEAESATLLFTSGLHGPCCSLHPPYLLMPPYSSFESHLLQEVFPDAPSLLLFCALKVPHCPGTSHTDDSLLPVCTPH